MTDNTEPTIDELISNLACATHFLPEEDCIYCDTEKIKALIRTEKLKLLDTLETEYDKEYQLAVKKNLTEPRETPRTKFHDIITKLREGLK